VRLLYGDYVGALSAPYLADVRAEDVVDRIGKNAGLIDGALEEFADRVHNAANKIGADRTFQDLIEDAHRSLPNK